MDLLLNEVNIIKSNIALHFEGFDVLANLHALLAINCIGMSQNHNRNTFVCTIDKEIVIAGGALRFNELNRRTFRHNATARHGERLDSGFELIFNFCIASCGIPAHDEGFTESLNEACPTLQTKFFENEISEHRNENGRAIRFAYERRIRRDFPQLAAEVEFENFILGIIAEIFLLDLLCLGDHLLSALHFPIESQN